MDGGRRRGEEILVAVDFVKAAQEWDPDTGNSSNYLVLRFAQTEFRVKVVEEEMAHFIAAAMRHQTTPHVSDEDLVSGPREAPRTVMDAPLEEHLYTDPRYAHYAKAEEEDEDDGEVVFGGDVPQVAAAPQMFETDDFADTEEAVPRVIERSSVQQRKDQIQQTLQNRAQVSESDRLKVLRQKARQVPHRRVRSDENGYPDPDDVRQVARATRRVIEQPEVQHTPVHTSIQGDDDGFEQG
jgi:hypothetical protein